MKFLVVSAFYLSCAASAVMARDVVVVEARPSSQNPRLTISSSGKLQPGANIAVYNAEGEQRLSLKADSHGKAKFPDLPPGQYCVVASTTPTLRANLCLQIADGHARKRSAFSMELIVQPPPPPTFKQKLEAAEKAPIEMLTRALAGTVHDPAGGVVSGASVAIYEHGTHDTTHPLTTTTNQQGRFYADLRPGKYTVVIQSPGFETRYLRVEISPNAAQDDLAVKLNLGAIA